MKKDVLYPRLELKKANADDKFLMEASLRVDSSEPHRIAVDTALIVLDDAIGTPSQLSTNRRLVGFYKSAFADGRYACDMLARLNVHLVGELDTYDEFVEGQSVAGMIRAGPMSHPSREAVKAGKWMFDNDYCVEAIDLYRLGFDAGFSYAMSKLGPNESCRVEKRRASYRC